MKTRLLLLSALSMLLNLSINAQEITLTFENARNTNDGTNDFYEADIFLVSTVPYKFGDGLIYFNYNTAAFGENIAANGSFELITPEESILGLPEGRGFFYGTNFVDNTAEIVSTNYFTPFSAGGLASENVTNTPTLLFSIKMQYLDVSQDAGISFNTEINGSTEQFFTACGPFDEFDDKNCTNFPNEQISGDNAAFDSTGAEIEDSTLSTITFGSLEKGTIDVFPNPVVDTFTIQGDTAIIDSAAIYNVNGVLLKKIAPKQLNQDVFMADFFPGIYFLQLVANGKQSTIKLIKI